MSRQPFTAAVFRVALLASLFTTSVSAQRLISEGDTWKYFKGQTSAPPNNVSGYNWTQQTYDDSIGWLSGRSGFGYGDGDDRTLLTDMQQISGAQPGYASLYIRKKFAVVNPATVAWLTLAIDYDDGFVAYVNGVEVGRGNMPAFPSAVNFDTLASSNHEASRGDAGSNPQERTYIGIDPALLVAGTNILAISGHNVSLASPDFSLIPELSVGLNLLRGPYLQMPAAGGMTIVWRTDAATDSAVDFGLDANYSGGSITDSNLVREHEITLASLQPNQTYFYRVRSGGVILSSATFRSPPTGAQPFRFDVVGDFGYATANTTNVANRIAATNPDLFLTVGDNIYNPLGGTGTGQPGIYDQYWFTPYAATMRRAPTFPTLGNHDLETANGSWYLSYFRLPQNGPPTELERNYSFDYGNAHFAVMDANPFVNPFDPVRAEAIRTWLANDLAATPQRWKFVLFHQPAYTSSGLAVHDPETTLQNEIQPICAQYGVQMVFQGHNHFYERINPINGVNYITSGAGGRSLEVPSVFPTYSAVVNSSVYSFTQVDINGGKLTLREIDDAGNQIDSFTYDLDHPFKMDGLLDSPAFERASNPNGLKLHAAIRGNFLYLATQDAGEGNDHFIYLNNQSAPLRAANWAKAGQVMGWSAFLADENESGFKGWFDASEQPLTDPAKYAATTSGLNNNGAAGNGVLEGTIDLRAHFGTFPPQLYLAGAPFSSPDGGALVSGAQVPAGNGDGDLQASEFLVLNTRDLALDLPVSDAGADQSVEAGMTVTLSGSGSAPSGLPATYTWTQLSGPAVTIVNPSALMTEFTPTSNVAAPTFLTFQLRVNDTRFETDDQVTVQLFPMLDSDGDGLSDQEELTGRDNSLTSANPAGNITNPNLADSDGDGMSDGSEAFAGTNPNDALSLFKIVRLEKTGSAVAVTWSSVVGRKYRVQSRSGFADAWVDIGNVVDGLGGISSTSVPVTSAPTFYRVRLVQ